MKITVETSVAAPIDIVWKAYTTPADIKAWNAASDDWHTTAASVDLREGGKFSSRMEAKDGSMGFNFAGTYTKIVPNKLIEYAFGDRAAQVEFTPGPDGVAVRVTFDSESTHSIEQQRGGWQAILNNFARHVEAKKRPKYAAPIKGSLGWRLKYAGRELSGIAAVHFLAKLKQSKPWPGPKLIQHHLRQPR